METVLRTCDGCDKNLYGGHQITTVTINFNTPVKERSTANYPRTFHLCEDCCVHPNLIRAFLLNK